MARRTWNQSNRVIPVRADLSLGALVNLDMVSGPVTATSTEAFRLFTVKLTWSLRDLTPGEGPIFVGLAHGDYTAAEIEEWLEATSAIQQGDKIAQEQSSRLCRRVGSFAGALAEETLNDGKPIRTKLNWMMATGQTLQMWAYNRSGATLTTGGSIVAEGTGFLRFT